jgi:hypothetical protein
VEGTAGQTDTINLVFWYKDENEASPSYIALISYRMFRSGPLYKSILAERGTVIMQHWDKYADLISTNAPVMKKAG